MDFDKVRTDLEKVWAEVSKTDFPKLAHAKLNLLKTHLSKVDLSQVDPRKVDWSKIDLRFVDWSKVDPRYVDWSKIDPRHVDWSKLDPREVDWSKIDLASFDPIAQLEHGFDLTRPTAIKVFLGLSVAGLILGAWIIYTLLWLVAPIPRPPKASEKKYRCVLPDGKVSQPRELPCWIDAYLDDKVIEEKTAATSEGRKKEAPREPRIEPAECFMSLVVPAYNEEARLGAMLREAVTYLDSEYGLPIDEDDDDYDLSTRTSGARARQMSRALANGSASPASRGAGQRKGWEVLVVSDGSTDKTVQTALNLARGLNEKRGRDGIRVVELQRNRGKGGAVTHGMRHVRGQYAVFADADGASKFQDLGKLVRECKKVEDKRGRGVAVGSRAHLVGSEAVVKRSFLRNFLMHSFHLLIRLLTPPSTGLIKDTQCGFKLFSRTSLPYIIPYMHSEGWIFDVEMLMLAESAKIPVAEVPVGWKEVMGSKLNVVWDSLGMAWGLAVLRAAWGLGIYEQS